MSFQTIATTTLEPLIKQYQIIPKTALFTTSQMTSDVVTSDPVTFEMWLLTLI